MRFDKFTVKAQEAVQRSQELASEHGQPQIEPLHLLKALLGQEEGVVGPLLRKPGAFVNYQYREQLYPTVAFRAAYDRLVADHGTRPGVIEYLHLLKLAVEHTVAAVEGALTPRLAGRKARCILRRSRTGRSTLSIESIWRCLFRACLMWRSSMTMEAQSLKRAIAASSRSISFCCAWNACCCLRRASSFCVW